MAELHNIPPVFDEHSRILILGSFPSVKSREGQFFYHHPQNRFWKVLAAVLGCEVPKTIEEKQAMLLHPMSLFRGSSAIAARLPMCACCSKIRASRPTASVMICRRHRFTG